MGERKGREGEKLGGRANLRIKRRACCVSEVKGAAGGARASGLSIVKSARGLGM